MIRFIFSLVTLLPFSFLFGQSLNVLDSVDITLPKTNQVNQLTNLSFEASQNNPALAIAYAEKAAEISQEIDYKIGLASALHKLSVTYRFQGYYDKALQYGDSALAILEIENDKSITASVYSNQGVSYRYKGNYEAALHSYQKAIELHKYLGQKTELGTVLNNLGVMYMSLEDYPKALEYYSKALELQIELDNKKEQANVYNNFAIIYANQGLLDSSLTYFQKSFDMEEALGNLKGMSESINNIGAVYYYQGDYDNAILQFQRSFDIDSALGDVRGQIACMSNIGELYNEIGQSKKAIIYLNRSLIAAREIDSKYDIEVAYINLSQSYAQLNQYQKALDMHMAYSSIHDTVLGQEQLEAIAEMETKYETKEKEQQIVIQSLELEDQEKDLQTQTITIFGLGLLILLVVGISIFGYRSFKARKAIEMERTLRQAEERRMDAVIDATESERKRIAQELHDGIGQQLSSIKLGMGVLEGEVENTSELFQKKLNSVKSIVDDSARDVRALSHHMMPKSLTELGLASAIEDMLAKSLGMGNIIYTYDASQLRERMAENIEVNLFRITQEITNNILKHSNATKVDIQLYATKSDVILIFAENGKGIDFNNSKSGHGMMNMETRIRKLDGTMRMEKESANQFVISLKVPLISTTV